MSLANENFAADHAEIEQDHGQTIIIDSAPLPVVSIGGRKAFEVNGPEGIYTDDALRFSYRVAALTAIGKSLKPNAMFFFLGERFRVVSNEPDASATVATVTAECDTN